jgi:hypothetical protein
MSVCGFASSRVSVNVTDTSIHEYMTNNQNTDMRASKQ